MAIYLCIRNAREEQTSRARTNWNPIRRHELPEGSEQWAVGSVHGQWSVGCEDKRSAVCVGFTGHWPLITGHGSGRCALIPASYP